MTKDRFYCIRSRLMQRFDYTGNYNPENPTEEFVVGIIEAERKLAKEVEQYEEDETLKDFIQNEYIQMGRELEKYLGNK